MALLKHPRTLTDRIPEEVRQRTRKAGAEEIDWYAGRLDVTNVGSNHAFTDPPSEEIARLKAMAAKRRRAGRANAKQGVTSLFRGLLRRGLRRRPRPSG